MLRVVVLIICTVFTFACFGAGGGSALSDSSSEPPCDLPEIVPHQPIYNALLCDGHEALKDARFNDALSLLEQASAMPLSEFPNFKSLPLLALAHHRAGNRARAAELFALSEAALFVILGTYRCVETDTGYALYRRHTRLSGQLYEQTIQRMCGAAYDYLYENDTLKSVFWQADLVRRHLALRRMAGK